MTLQTFTSSVYGNSCHIAIGTLNIMLIAEGVEVKIVIVCVYYSEFHMSMIWWLCKREDRPLTSSQHSR